MSEPTILHPRLRALTDELRETEAELDRLQAKMLAGKPFGLDEASVILNKTYEMVRGDCVRGFIEANKNSDFFGGYSIPANEVARKLDNAMKLERERLTSAEAGALTAP